MTARLNYAFDPLCLSYVQRGPIAMLRADFAASRD